MKSMNLFIATKPLIFMVDNNLVSLAILAKKEGISIGWLKNMISQVHNSTPYKTVLLFKIALFSPIERLHIIIQ